jgi:riboflavin synthase
MFTGIVQDVGTISKIEKGNGAMRLRIATALAERMAPGNSVSVNGVCLTAAEVEGMQFMSALMPHTVSKTTLGDLTEGALVNVEPSLRAGDEIGGHFVFGHVDGLGEILEREEDGDSVRLTIGFPEELAPLIAPRGSITVDGVSLTVSDVSGGTFSVSLVQYTLMHTAFQTKEAGDMVNIEADMLARYARFK